MVARNVGMEVLSLCGAAGSAWHIRARVLSRVFVPCRGGRSVATIGDEFGGVMKRWVRIVLTSLSAVIGLTAIAGGLALLIGTATATVGSGAVPESSFLDGSPFTSYLLPGLVLRRCRRDP